jgi:hypothetical protein
VALGAAWASHICLKGLKGLKGQVLTAFGRAPFESIQCPPFKAVRKGKLTTTEAVLGRETDDYSIGENT